MFKASIWASVLLYNTVNTKQPLMNLSSLIRTWPILVHMTLFPEAQTKPLKKEHNLDLFCHLVLTAHIH